MPKNQEDELYELESYRELLKLKPDNFYVHLPLQIPLTKWFFEGRLQLLLSIGLKPNYFGLRHSLSPDAQWFSDWVFLNHYQLDGLLKKKWKPSLLDRIRYRWLMQQGYFKEQEQYLKLFARNEEGKATVQERKFLKKYGECRYWWYIDCAREDELAFFRLGVDADEPLNNEDKPLFPNIAYSYADDPVLAYFIDNTMHTEYMPPTYTKSAKQRVRKRLMKKWNKNEKVVYADMRKMFNPDTTKIHDLEFLFHCYKMHDGAPTDPKEKELFVHLFSLYSKEITHLAQMMHYPELEILSTAHPRKRLNPLYVAYKQRWLGVNLVKDFEKVFHGVTLDDYQKIVNSQYKLLDKKPHRQLKNKPANKDTKKQIDDLLLFIIKQK